ncbi:MAG: AbrB/MazE/SpoVT family DNA-binding domain-containing protein [Panacagrimonas sp.]
MESAVLSTKGQLVLPKPVRDALRIKPGHRLSIRVEGSRIVLERAVPPSADAWTPLNPAGARVSTEALCNPVMVKREARKR